MIVKTSDGLIYDLYTKEELESFKTRQLLRILRSTHSLDWNWGQESQTVVENYRNLIKQILSTREHIPNKIESKNIRKMKIKRGV